MGSREGWGGAGWHAHLSPQRRHVGEEPTWANDYEIQVLFRRDRFCFVSLVRQQSSRGPWRPVATGFAITLLTLCRQDGQDSLKDLSQKDLKVEG